MSAKDLLRKRYMKMEYKTFISKHYDIEKLDLSLGNSNYLFLIYDDKYYYYLKNKKFLDAKSITNILEVINDLNESCQLKITNYYPISFCKNTLVIAFRADVNSISNLEKVKYFELSDNYKKLCKYHEEKFSTIFISSNVEKEITMSQKYIRRYKFHERFIKKYIFNEKKRKKKEFHELLVELIPKKNSIIDVSCGDNSDIFRIAREKGYKTIVGNDICLNYLKTQKDLDVIFTNDNIEENSIKKKSYDVSFVKNTLHHMNNILCINNLLDMLANISNEIVIVEILDPQETGGLPKFLNTYLYTKFLKDVGRCYLNEVQLKNIIYNKFKNCKIEYHKFVNVLGEYMVFKIVKEEG